MPIKFSIVIPAYNAENTLGRCLESIRRMDFPRENYEVVVVNDGSTDETARVAREFGARVITKRCHSLSAVRNLGASETTGEVLAFLDSDVLVDPKWLASAAEYFDAGFSGALHFADDVPDDAGWIGRFWHGHVRERKDRTRNVDNLAARNLCVNRGVHEECGGFDERLFWGKRAGEDKEYTYRLHRAGHRVVSDSSLRMTHLGVEKGIAQFVRKEWWHQGSTVLTARKYGYPLRLLCNPFASAFHLLCLAGLPVVLAAGNVALAAVLAAAWTLPSCAVTLGKMNVRRHWRYFPVVWFLTFVRWNVAGVALIPQLGD